MFSKNNARINDIHDPFQPAVKDAIEVTKIIIVFKPSLNINIDLII